jgi:hypothetical protein
MDLMLDLLPLPSDGLVRLIFDESVIFGANLIDFCLQKGIGFVDLSEDLMPTFVIGSTFYLILRPSVSVTKNASICRFI